MDTQSGSRVRLSLRRKRTRLDLTSHPGDDDDIPQEAPLASGAPSSGSLDSKDCTQLGIKTGPHIKAEGTAWQETQPLSRKLRGRNANEPKESHEICSEAGDLSHDVDLDSHVLCPLCHMDLTSFSITQRQEHANRCSDGGAGCGRGQQGEEPPVGHVCVLCAKCFKSEQSKLSHMKQCAKRGGISTEALVQLNRVAVESLLTAPMSDQSNPSAVAHQTGASGEPDFKPPPCKVRKLKKQKEPKDYLQLLDEDQFQMALALSASIDTQTSVVSTEPMLIGRKTRQQKLCDDVIPPLLLTTSSESEKLVAARAEKILIPAEGVQGTSDGGDIPCTPPFPPSRLGQCAPPPAPPSSCVDDVLFGGEETVCVVGGDCMGGGGGGESCSDSDHLVTWPHPTAIPPPDVGGRCEVALSLPHPALQQEPVVAPCDQTDVGLLWSQACGGHHLEYPTIWQLTGCQDTAAVESFYVPALHSVISPVKRPRGKDLGKDVGEDLIEDKEHSTNAPVLETTPTLPSFGGVEQLLIDLHGLLGSALFNDVVMVTRDGTHIPSHGAILCSRCPCLREILQGSCNRPVLLDLSEFSTEGVFGFLEWMYTGSCSLLGQPPQGEVVWGLQGEVATLMERCLRGGGIAELPAHYQVRTEGGGGLDTPTKDVSLPTHHNILPQRSPVSQGHLPQRPPDHFPQRSPDHLPQRSPDHLPQRSSDYLTQRSPVSQDITEIDSHTTPITNSPILVDSSASDSEGGEGGERGEGPLEKVPKKRFDNSISPVGGSPSSLPIPTIATSADVLARSCDESVTPDELHIRSCDQEAADGRPNLISCDRETIKQRPTSVISLHDDQRSHAALHPVSSYKDGSAPLIYTTPPTSPPMDLSPSSGSVLSIPPTPHHPSPTPHHPSHDDGVVYSPILRDSPISVFSSPGDLVTPNGSPSCLENVSPVLLSCSDHISSPGPDHTSCIAISSPSTHRTHSDARTISLSSSDSIPAPPPTTSTVFTPQLNSSPPPSPPSPPPSPPSPPPSSPSPPPWSPPPLSPLSTPVPPLPPKTAPSSLTPSSPLVPSPPCMDRSTFLHAFEDDAAASQPLPLPGTSQPLPLPGTSQPLPLPVGCAGFHTVCVTTPIGDGAGDNDVTPMPDFQTMRTPALRDQCTRYGVRPLPKRKMIVKLQEIYEYTHPLVDQNTEVITSKSQPAVSRELVVVETSPPVVASSDEEACTSQLTSTKAPAGQKKRSVNVQQLMESVREAIMKDPMLYQDILLYKPLELADIKERLRAASVNIPRKRLKDILDQLCITYSCPRPPPPRSH